MEWHNEKRKLSELKPMEGNPRKATEKQAKDLFASLEKFDLVDPIIVNTDNTIIGGHFRHKIASEYNQGEDVEVDVRVPDRELMSEEVNELNLRLNKNTGEWDNDLLANFDAELLKLVCWESEDLDKILQLESTEEEEKTEKEESVKCPRCGFEWKK